MVLILYSISSNQLTLRSINIENGLLTINVSLILYALYFFIIRYFHILILVDISCIIQLCIRTLILINHPERYWILYQVYKITLYVYFVFTEIIGTVLIKENNVRLALRPLEPHIMTNYLILTPEIWLS